MNALDSWERAEKAAYLLGYLKAQQEKLSADLKVTEEEAREILINGLIDRLKQTKN